MYVIYDPPPKKKNDLPKITSPFEHLGKSAPLTSSTFARSTFARPVIGDYQHLGLRVFRFRKLKGWKRLVKMSLFLGVGVISGICIEKYIQYDYICSCTIMLYMYICNYIIIYIYVIFDSYIQS